MPKVFRQLIPFTSRYKVYSTRVWVVLGESGFKARLPGGKTAPVSDELAAKTLNGRLRPCPNIGRSPTFGVHNPDSFRLYGGLTGGTEPVTVISCSICGLLEQSPGDPDAARIRGDDPSKGFIHPERDYVVTNWAEGAANSVRWVEEVPPQESPAWGEPKSPGTPGYFDVPTANLSHERLIVWVKGIHLRKDGAKRAAKRRYPRATVIGEEKHFLILRETLGK